MIIGRVSFLLGLSIVVLPAFSGEARAVDFADCVRVAATRDLEAKTEFQHGVRDLIVRDRPEIEGLATAYMELQILLAEARRTQIGYLLDTDPDRLDTSSGLTKFANFEWTEEDEARLTEHNETYRELEDRIAIVREQNDTHPDWPSLRAYFRSAVAQKPGFVTLMDRFQARQGEVGSLLVQCGSE